MTATAAAWQFERLSPEARKAAEATALATGLPLGGWLAQLITESAAAEGIFPPPPPASEPVPVLPSVPMPDAVAPPTPETTEAPIAFAPPPPAPSAPWPAAPSQPWHTAPLPPQAAPSPPPQAAPSPSPPQAIPTPPQAAPAPLPIVSAPPPAEASPPQSAAQPASESAIESEASPFSLDLAGAVVMIPVSALEPGRCGTRRADDQLPSALLSAIATEGMRQPLLVRRRAAGYEIIAGSRRWRAAQRIGLDVVPAIVATLDDARAVLASLTENLQTDDFSLVEEARTYLRLLTEFGLDAAGITKATGRDRPHIARTLRLLGLPARVRTLIELHYLSPEHAFLLLGAPDPERLADAIIVDKLSVEETALRLAAGSAAERAQ